jgi:hypothetical protein
VTLLPSVTSRISSPGAGADLLDGPLSPLGVARIEVNGEPGVGSATSGTIRCVPHREIQACGFTFG